MSDPSSLLLVEDDPTLLSAFGDALCREGYQVVQTADGAEAVRLVADRRFDLIVADMLLPGASGFQVAQAARERAGPRVPVLMVSANGSPAHRAYAEAVGVDGYLVKPFDLPELLREAGRLCPPGREAPSDRPGIAAPR